MLRQYSKSENILNILTYLNAESTLYAGYINSRPKGFFAKKVKF